MLTFAVLIVTLVAWWAVEYQRHHVRLSYLPTRIHVNGTRGKSSVTRLIYGALHHAGHRVIGKTTGTHPRYLDVDGGEHEIARVGKPNIREQVEITRRAFREQAEGMVLECMALQPELQSLAEDKIVRAKITVITNVRADHFDVMGPTRVHVARALARTCPKKGVLFTAESDSECLEVLGSAAARRGTRLVGVDASEIGATDMAGFTYVEHPENVAVALAVARHFGVERQQAIEGMWRANPDPGVLRVMECEFHGRRIRFVNAFAANDPDSIRLIFERLGIDASRERVIIVIYCRRDRLQRSEQMADLLASDLGFHLALLVGSETRMTAARAVRSGANPEKVVSLEGMPIEPVMERIVAEAGDGALVIGIGNIVGLGEEIVQRFKNREDVNRVHGSDRARAGHQPHLL
jgi:poly-gamma-glutamate synthase PgsB/CapB